MKIQKESLKKVKHYVIFKILSADKFVLNAWIFLLCLFSLITATSAQIGTSTPEARTMWEFMNEYKGNDKITRILNSFAVGSIGGCSGTLISPHVFMTAAHCGGPDIWKKEVRFFRIDEDKTPSSLNQRMSEPYVAHALHWQHFRDKTGPQIGDMMLWWLDDGSDGIPPGVKYGYIGLSSESVNAGDEAYSFWVNPVNQYHLGNTLLHSFGTATSESIFTNRPLKFFTDYTIFGERGCSGSSVIGTGRHKNQVIGVTAIVATFESTPTIVGRRVADTSSFLTFFDADKNGVLDVIEYDMMLTAAPRNFYHLIFTPLEQSQWHSNTYNSPCGFTSYQGKVVHIGGCLIGPSAGAIAYQTFGDSPIKEYVEYFENFEDGMLNTPGVSASAGVPYGPGGNTDSVDEDDGNDKDYSGTGGHSFFSSNGQAGIKFTFDANTLGSLPTYAGIVWTDGAGMTTFEAFDVKGNSLGRIGPVAIADDSYSGTAREDRFFGVIERGGISAIKIWNSSGGIEVDHLQYGRTKVPVKKPDAIEHYNARFVPNAKYRISILVYGLATDSLSAYIKFRSDSSGDELVLPYEPALNQWRRIERRVTLRNYSDYRLVLGNSGNNSFYVNSIDIIREDGGAKLDFETDEERRSWEYAGGSYPTSWGMDGSNDFSGVVVADPNFNSLQWGLRNRHIALELNKRYTITFDVWHVSGLFDVEHFMKIEKTHGDGTSRWRFAHNNEKQTKTLQITTSNESGNAIDFGSTGKASYMIDNIRIEETP